MILVFEKVTFWCVCKPFNFCQYLRYVDWFNFEQDDEWTLHRNLSEMSCPTRVILSLKSSTCSSISIWSYSHYREFCSIWSMLHGATTKCTFNHFLPHDVMELQQHHWIESSTNIVFPQIPTLDLMKFQQQHIIFLKSSTNNSFHEILNHHLMQFQHHHLLESSTNSLFHQIVTHNLMQFQQHWQIPYFPSHSTDFFHIWWTNATSFLMQTK